MVATLEQRDVTHPSAVVAGSVPAARVDRISKIFVQRPLFFRGETKIVNAVSDISFTVQRGEIFGILGANGSGKSTLIRMLSTLLIPDEGTVEVFGFDVQRNEAEVKRLINRVSVEASFFKKLSPAENLAYALRLYGRSGPEVREESFAVLERLGVARSKLNEPLEQLSRGMQQKVAIARALLTSPVLLLLDEPTTGLDPRSKLDVQRFVHVLRDTHDATILLCTHDMAEAEALCDRVMLLDKGRLIALDTVPTLKAQYGPELGTTSPTLEEIFIHLTGRSLEEARRTNEQPAAHAAGRRPLVGGPRLAGVCGTQSLPGAPLLAPGTGVPDLQRRLGHERALHRQGTNGNGRRWLAGGAVGPGPLPGHRHRGLGLPAGGLLERGRNGLLGTLEGTIRHTMMAPISGWRTCWASRSSASSTG
ncbi:MAG: ABC transporter ATP-binding protein [Thermomicrobiales bacterium]